MGNRRRSWLVVTTLVGTLSILAATAVAQNSREGEAETLFKQGKTAMDQGNLVVACEKFRSSNDLAPRATTLMNLGKCQEASKKLFSAWYSFVTAAKLASRATDTNERSMEAQSNLKAKELESRRSSIEVVVSAEARVPGLVISRDGDPIVDGQWNSEIYVDGGEYTIVARARDTDAWSAKVSVASELDKTRVEIPVLKITTVTPPPPPEVVKVPDVIVTPTPPEAPRDEPAAPRDAPSSFTGMRKAAVGVAAVGIVALAGGAVFGMKSGSKQSDADAICPGTICNDAEGLRLNDEAQSAAGTANLLYIGGGVAVAGGIALWVLGAPKARSDDELAIVPHVGTDIVGLSLSGGF